MRPETSPAPRTLAAAGFQREGLLRSFLAFADGRSDMVVWACLPGDHGATAQLDLDHVQLAAPAGCEDDARAFLVACSAWLSCRSRPASAAAAACGSGSASGNCTSASRGVSRPHKAHPALAVDSRALDVLAARLQTAGAPVDWDDELPGIRRLYTADPWGNRIEILARAERKSLQPAETRIHHRRGVSSRASRCQLCAACGTVA